MIIDVKPTGVITIFMLINDNELMESSTFSYQKSSTSFHFQGIIIFFDPWETDTVWPD